ncbi:MAG TPA: MFS transporter [Pseudonocardiaceae bacterium]|jgi:predicted MFS family arabinose efflux permease|nr:MFS transporter [Pseudonocardiaceae bacterium]
MPCDAVAPPVVDRMARQPGGNRGNWLPVAMLAIGTFAIGTDVFVVAGVLGGLAGDLNVTVGVAGLTVTVFALAYAIGAPLLSVLPGARHVRPVLIGSLALFGLFNLTSAVAPSLGVLVGSRVLSALVASVYVPVAGAAAVAGVSATQRGRAFAVVLGGSSVAMVLGAPLGVLLAEAYSWRVAFDLVAGLAAVTALGLWPVALGPQAAPLLLGLNSSAIHRGFAAGAFMGGQVVDTTGPVQLWVLAVTCCGAGLVLHTLLTRRSRP